MPHFRRANIRASVCVMQQVRTGNTKKNRKNFLDNFPGGESEVPLATKKLRTREARSNKTVAGKRKSSGGHVFDLPGKPGKLA